MTVSVGEDAGVGGQEGGHGRLESCQTPLWERDSQELHITVEITKQAIHGRGHKACCSQIPAETDRVHLCQMAPVQAYV